MYPLPSSTLEPHQISLICSVEGGRGYIEGGIHILIVTIPVPCHRHLHIYKLYDKATPKQAPVALFLYLVLYSFMEKKT